MGLFIGFGTLARSSSSRACHFIEKMVDVHCERDEEGFTLHWLVAFHSVRVRVSVGEYIHTLVL